MKVTLQTLACRPMGVAKPGTVLDMPPEEAERLIANRCARVYDKERDAKAKHGYDVAKRGEQE